jgi:hypothetical protein
MSGRQVGQLHLVDVDDMNKLGQRAIELVTPVGGSRPRRNESERELNPRTRGRASDGYRG